MKPAKKSKEPKGPKGSIWKKLFTFFGYLICLGVIMGSIVLVLLTKYLVDVTAEDGDDLTLTDQIGRAHV